MEKLEDVLILLTASVLVVAVFRRLYLPPIIGYLCVGVVLGPSVTGLLGGVEDVRLLAEFGVVFLLFTIGLEFSLPQLIAMRMTVMGLGGAQVLITSVVTGAVAYAIGASWQSAIVVGGALALSSTALVTKQLTEQFEVHTRHGRNAVGVLLFQDLAVVPLLVIIPILASGDPERLGAMLAWAILKGLGAFLAMLLIGRWALRPLFHEVAAARSTELFTLAVLLVALTAAWATHLAGLSLALGAFLAGVMLGETEYRHQIEADIRPFRDILLGLFFISVGMLLDLAELAATWYWVVLALAGLVLFKGAVIYAVVRLFGEDRRVAARTAIVLAQGGEFGFAVLSLALPVGVVGETAAQVVLAAIVLSMVLAPVLIRHNEGAAHRLARAGFASHGPGAAAAVRQLAEPLTDHVVICGYGRTGQNVARFLENEGIPYLALDLDPARVREAQAAGERVQFGDATHREILEATGLGNARLLVLTFEDPQAALKVLRHAREQRPDIPVTVRTRDDVYLERFREEGATEIVPETLEASLMLASHTLAMLEVPLSRVFRYVREVRADRYRVLKSYFHGRERQDPQKLARFREQLHAVTLPEEAHAVGRQLAELDLEGLGVTVTAVRRGGIRGPQPEPETVLISGDVLVLYGVPEALERAESVLLTGQ
ncbi:cation:proton antiporter [Ectothiorhodospiraceae bacterium WFHF3C12]|nr:cation:proton antiporter [Ectothiorhodospiraceae bacterium WFHF3C12]